MNKISNTQLLLLGIVLVLVNAWLLDFYIVEHNLYSISLKGFSQEIIAKMLHLREKMLWFSYVIVAITYTLNVLLGSLIIYIGALFSDKKVGFGEVFRLFTIVEFINIFYLYIRTLNIYIFRFKSFEDLQVFWPFSLFDIIQNDVPKYLYYPFATFNISLLFFFLLLAKKLKSLLHIPTYGKSVLFVLQTYGNILLVWISLIVFINLYFGN